jgi:small subunit ribosomal protein S1
MVHVSEMSWTRRVRHPNEVVSLDEGVEVMVLSVDAQAEKIALGLKQTRPNPWREMEQRYPAGSIVKGTVRNLTDYGAFIEIEEGIDALLHVSDISWTKKVAHPSEVLERDQVIEVKVLSTDPQSEKISVGLKQLEKDPWQEVVDKHAIGSYVDVEIAKLVSFGAFARLENGIEGLIHVSELSKNRVTKPEEVLSVGDKATAKVISIDPAERKIGLSLREYQQDMDASAQAQYGSSGSQDSVSIGDVVGDAVPRSLLEGGQSLADAANQMMAEMSSAPAPEGDAPKAEEE